MSAFVHMFDLLHKSGDDLFFRLFFSKTQSHKFNKLLPCNFAYCRFVKKAGVGAVCVYFRYCAYRGSVHYNGIALGVAVAKVVAVHI